MVTVKGGEVVFRIWKDTREVFAMFPNQTADLDDGGMCQGYIPGVGENAIDHSYAMRNSRRATPAEYADLKLEMERQGYSLDVIRRAPNGSASRRRKVVDDYWNKRHRQTAEALKAKEQGEPERLERWNQMVASTKE